jgi:branched-chain amino acid transport system substrate-binding protein
MYRRYFLLAILLMQFVVGCGKKEPEVIKIGAALPLTGDGAVYGQNAKKAIELALDELGGLINGRRVLVVYEDTKLEPKEAATAVTKLVTVDKVPVIIGPMASSEVEAVLPICQKNKVVIVSPSATDHKLSEAGGYFFRTITSDTYEGREMARFAFKDMGYRKMAVFYIESAGPFGVSEAFSQEFKELGGRILLTEKAAQNAIDVRAQLARIKGNKVDAMFFAGFAAETATMLKQARQIGLNLQILAHQTAEAPEVRQIAGKAAEGVILASPSLDTLTAGESVKMFYRAFRQKYGEDPQNYAPNTYDAFMLVVRSIREHGYEADSIIKGLLETKDYSGASGKITFTQTGDIVQPMRIMTIANGKVVPFEKSAFHQPKKLQ